MIHQVFLASGAWMPAGKSYLFCALCRFRHALASLRGFMTTTVFKNKKVGVRGFSYKAPPNTPCLKVVRTPNAGPWSIEPCSVNAMPPASAYQGRLTNQFPTV